MPTITIQAHADAYVDQGAPDTNFGDETILKVRTELDANRRAYLVFDMDQVPDDFVEWRDPVAITVQLVTTDNPTTENRRVNLEDLADAFDELGLTWNNQPGLDVGLIEYDEATGDALHFDLLGVLQVIPLSGPWPLRLVDDAEDDDSLEGPFEQELAAREHDTRQPATFHATYQAQRQADLASTLTVRRSASQDLETDVLPRIPAEADLEAAVDVVYAAELGATVTPALHPVDVAGRAEGVIAHPFLEPLNDVRRIAEEAGTLVQRTEGADRANLHRVVQIVDSNTGLPLPQSKTSGPGDETRLRRGDAVLFGLEGDGWRPGEEVTWQGQRWVVAGVLDEERLDEKVLYREIGLRRLAVTTRGRVEGVIA